MDYKTVILSNELAADNDMLPDIPGLHFVVVREDVTLFDYTAYFEENDLAPIDYKIFMRQNKHFIAPLAKAAGKSTAELFYQNKNGHILVVSELTFLFLAFANPEMLIYINSLVADAISEGVAYSNGFIYRLAEERIPSDVLAEIQNERENGTSEEGKV